MTTIPLNKLTAAKTNVRKTGAGDGIGELAASIASHGLLASLVVKKAARGRYTVIAGQRRFKALLALAAADKIAADLPVSCHLADDDADPTEIGLAENVVRAPMHPADQFEAFRAVIDKGSSVTDVAARFGISDGIVIARLRLGRVSPAILDAYRAGELNLGQVQAFTLSDDHTAQERVWTGLSRHDGSPGAIRRALTEGEIPATDKRVRFIGLEAYEDAGGAVRRDLFDERNAGYILDADLLSRLVQQELDTQAHAIRAEGWSWVEARDEFGYAERSAFRRAHPATVDLPEAEAAELEQLQAEFDALSEGEIDGDGDSRPDITERLGQIEERIDALNAMASRWTPDDMAMAGAVVYLTGDGDVEVERGLIRPEDAHTAQEDAAGLDDTPEPETPLPALPSTLVADLTAQKTAAIRCSLAQQPDMALAAVAHALARSAFYSYGGETCLDLTLRQRSLTTPMAQADECSGLFGFDAERGKWAERLPGDADDLWNWCLAQSQDTLLDLLAVSAAHAVDAVREKSHRADDPSLLHADALAEALKLDMHDWFTPTVGNYFGRVNRICIMEALSEAGRPVRTRSWSKLKKSELAALAERELDGTGWLPQPLRMKADEEQSSDTQADMPVAAAA